MRKYKLGATKYTFGSEAEPCITFPWIDIDENGRQTVKRIKVRSIKHKANQRLDPSGNSFRIAPRLFLHIGKIAELRKLIGGHWGFFGWHTVPADAKEIVITEGEFDAMSVHQVLRMSLWRFKLCSHLLPLLIF